MHGAASRTSATQSPIVTGSTGSVTRTHRVVSVSSCSANVSERRRAAQWSAGSRIANAPHRLGERLAPRPEGGSPAAIQALRRGRSTPAAAPAAGTRRSWSAAPAPGRRRAPRTPPGRSRTSWPPRRSCSAAPAARRRRAPSSTSPAARSADQVGRAALVVDDGQRLALGLEPEHRLDEVGAGAAVHPGRADDVGVAPAASRDGPLAGQLGPPVGRRAARSGRRRRRAGRRRRRRRSRWTRGPARRRGRPASAASQPGARPLTSVGGRLVGLGRVHRGVRGRVDQDGAVGPHPDSQLRTASRTAASSVRSSSARPRPVTSSPDRVPRTSSEVGAELTPGAGDQPGDGAAVAHSASCEPTDLVRRRRRGLERLPPGAVVAVPLHGQGQAVLEGHPRRVAQRGGLGVVDRVAQVVAAAARVDDVLDVAPVAAGGLEQLLGQLLVGQLAAAADVVELARPPVLDDELDAAAVVVDEQPVAHVGALAVERHLLRRRAGW